MSRPAGSVGEIRAALRVAAQELVASLPADRGSTLRELAAGANVGVDAATHTVKHMSNSGELVIVGARRVEYRNRPVAEYRPGDTTTATAGEGFVDLGTALQLWGGSR